MGFEYKIRIDLTELEKEEIRNLIPPKKEVTVFQDEIIFEEDGIYVCKYDRPDLWCRLEKIRSYLQNGKEYNVEEL
jgi:hypothetical protein